MKHSVALLRTKDPLFRRSGASRLTRIATDGQFIFSLAAPFSIPSIREDFSSFLIMKPTLFELISTPVFC